MYHPYCMHGYEYRYGSSLQSEYIQLNIERVDNVYINN